MVETVLAPSAASRISIAFASAAPSIGSVPAQSSSKSTSESSSACSVTDIMLTICDENVESDCSMLCSSPISAKTFENIATRLPSSVGIISPHIVIRVKSPIVLRVTVLPPVLGPVITSVSYSLPNSTVIGTTARALISGWRARLR